MNELAQSQVTDVKIKLSSTIRPLESDVETYEMWLDGQWLQKGDAYYLKYSEQQQGQEIRTTIKMNDERALIMRSGAIGMRLPLHLDEQQTGRFETELGSLPLHINTKKLHYTPNANDGEFHTQYELIISGEVAGQYMLTIEFTEAT